MPHNAAFHLGLHCLTKYLFTGMNIEKGVKHVNSSFLKILIKCIYSSIVHCLEGKSTGIQGCHRIQKHNSMILHDFP